MEIAAVYFEFTTSIWEKEFYGKTDVCQRPGVNG
jgi:hypothetical protein